MPHIARGSLAIALAFAITLIAGAQSGDRA